jgi:hypothetical protein
VLVLVPAIPSVALANRPSVSVVLGGASGESGAMREVLAAVLESRGVDARFRERPSLELREVLAREDGPEVGRIWIDMRAADGEVRLFIADARAERILVRSIGIEGRDSIDEIARETVGNIVDATVEALLAGIPIGRPRAEIEAELGLSPPEPPPVEEEEPIEMPAVAPAIAVAVEAGYRAALWVADEAPLHGPGVGIEIASGQKLRFGVRFDAWLVLPTAYETDLAGVSIAGGDFRLQGLAALSPADVLSVGLSLGVAAGVLSATPRTGGLNSLVVSDSFAFGTYRVTGGFELRVVPVESMWIRLAVTIDVDLVDTRFVVRAAETTSAALDPSRFWPALELAVAVRVD